MEGAIDLAVVSVPTAQLGGVVIDAAHKGAHGLVVLTGGADGAHDNRTVVNLARAYGVRAVGPDALGLINTDYEVGLNASPAPMPRQGVVGLFCQSAAIGVSLLNYARKHDLGLSSFLSTGDFADVTGNDVMQFWEDDDRTAVCLLSLDSIGNPRKFSRIVRRLARRKPVVVFSPGRADRADHYGVRGGLGHAEEAAVDALFRQNGVVVAHRRQGMIDVARRPGPATAPERPAPAADHQLGDPGPADVGHSRGGRSGAAAGAADPADQSRLRPTSPQQRARRWPTTGATR